MDSIFLYFNKHCIRFIGICVFLLNTAYSLPKGSHSTENILMEMQHEVENHEIELHLIKERLHTQENILDSLREQLSDVQATNQEFVKKNNAVMMTDLRQLQDHANTSAKTLLQYKQKIAALEETIDNLQQVLHSLVDLVAIDSEKSYEVKSGDSLEKIARSYASSVQELKELNDLKSDRIYIGQKLLLPSRK